jgi:chromosome segregation ATPase
MSEQEQKQQHTEGSPWFWKIFGSAIVGAMTFLLVAHITNINSNIERSKTEIKMDVKELKMITDSNRDKITDLERMKDQITALSMDFKELTVSFDERKQKITAIEVSLEHQKTEIESMKTLHTKLTEQLQELKEKMIASETKDILVEEQKKELELEKNK